MEELATKGKKYYKLSAEKFSALIMEDVFDFALFRGAFAGITGNTRKRNVRNSF